MKAIAVIGSAWGDEGKGLLTDYFSTPDTVVVRFNGGAQAGHTVVRNGQRHVFKHFGSGTLQGASTFLSRFFINNPILYFRELDVLRGLGHEPTVMVDPAGLVTTPWDMMINQMLEQNRGDGRHGSCGVGINETIQRSKHDRYRFTVGDLRDDPDHLRYILHMISQSWVPSRLYELKIEPNDYWQKALGLIHPQSVIQTFMDYCSEYLKAIRLSKLQPSPQMVFEGAQGLLLDEDHRFFPHVTHSHTGLKNVMALAAEIDLPASDLDVVYATRAYATRHGAGPFPREAAGLSYKDATNVPNMWQGTLRFGELDLDLLAESILNDGGDLPIRRKLAITCLDQVGPNVFYWLDEKKQQAPWEEMVRQASQKCEITSCLTSFGPTNADVKVFDGS